MIGRLLLLLMIVPLPGCLVPTISDTQSKLSKASQKSQQILEEKGLVENKIVKKKADNATTQKLITPISLVSLQKGKIPPSWQTRSIPPTASVPSP